MSTYIGSLTHHGTNDSHDSIETNGNAIACTTMGRWEYLLNSQYQTIIPWLPVWKPV
jgi:hypothetical protein